MSKLNITLTTALLAVNNLMATEQPTDLRELTQNKAVQTLPLVDEVLLQQNQIEFSLLQQQGATKPRVKKETSQYQLGTYTGYIFGGKRNGQDEYYYENGNLLYEGEWYYMDQCE